jgi:hypothetical protein
MSLPTRDNQEAAMENNGTDQRQDMMYVVGGLALLVLGAGLIASHPTIRKTLRAGMDSVLPHLQGTVGSQLAVLVPDVQRYLKLRNM